MTLLANRRDFLKTSGIGVVSMGLLGCAAASSTHTAGEGGGIVAETVRRPNILILFTDDQRFDTIHALGNSEIVTPNMDRLVANGTAFTDAYILGSCHGAVCMPSRAMLLTGRHYFNLPQSVVQSWSVPAAQRGDCAYVTFPETFREAGYDTFGTGKWHNGRPLFAKGFTDGDAIFFGGMSNHLKVPAYDFDPTGEYPPGGAKKRDKFSSELFSDAAIEFLAGRARGDDPFLMYVSYTAPHDPRMAPAEYAAMYPPEGISLPPNFMPQHPFPIGDLRVRDERLAGFPRTAEEVREHIAAYYAMITHVDAQIGRVLDALEATGEAENTIIILAGDNGLAVGQHGLLGKQNIYEHSARVPLVISGPGIPRGERCDALCYLHDVFPTICELSGLAIPDSVQSRSLAPLIRGQDEAVRDSVYLTYSTTASALVDGFKQEPGVLRGVRKGPWKLILSNCGGVVTTRLFNLDDDPWETGNLAGRPDAAERVEEMRVLLREWAARSGDTIDVDEPGWGFGPLQ